MKALQYILIGLALSYAAVLAKAQNTLDSVTVKYKNKTVTVQPQGDESYTTIKFKDTAINKKIVVKIAVLETESIEKKVENQLDSSSKKIYNMIKSKNYGEERKHFIETAFLPTFDIGFASTINNNDNSSAITPKLTKSANISLGIVRQNMNLVKGQLLLSYGLNLNNYYLKYENKQMVQYLDQNGHLKQSIDTVNKYYKNRLDIRYLSVPVLLEYHEKHDQFSIAAGVEFGFNGHTKYMLKGDNKGLEFKQKNDNEIKINPVQINAVIRIGIDNIAIFGKYNINEMYKESAYETGQNPQQHLFSFGVCIFGI